MNSLPVLSADLETPTSIYQKLNALKPAFLLESVVEGHERSRYSYIGLDPCRRVDVHEGESVRDVLARELHALKPLGVASHRLADGLVGAIGFEAVHDFLPTRRKPVSKDGLPLASFVVPRVVLSFDHFTQRLSLFHRDGPDAAQALMPCVRDLLQGALRESPEGASYSEPKATMSFNEFEAMVRRAKRHIESGDVFQVVLSFAFEGTTDVSAFSVYRALRSLNPSPYLFFHDFGDFQVLGSSPESLVRIENQRIALRPIAGTRPRGETTEQDNAYERELLGDEKENAEHNMLVDLARNDIGRVAKTSSVKVAQLRRVERYSHVMHMVSSVEGEQAEDASTLDVFTSTFPAGTLSGAPKVRALQLIDDLEVRSRGFYGGAAGYFSASGDMDHAIVIRSIVLHKGRYSIQAGAGIVADSDPRREYEEICNKAVAVRSAMRVACDELVEVQP